MAECLCEQLSAVEGELIAVSVLSLDLDVLGALCDAPLSREGQAALKTLLLAAERDDLGVYKLYHAFADIDNDDSAQHSDLRSRKTYAVSLVHGLCHVVEKGGELVVEFFNGTAALLENRVAVLNNISDSHSITLVL